MKKFAIKTVVFIIIFSMVFLGVQKVLHYRWEDTYAKYVDYASNPEGSIDVILFGTSELYFGYSPVAGYHAAGFTSYNLAMPTRSAMTTYYQFKYAIKHQKPKVVVCDFVALFDNLLPSESETVYRRAADSMPDKMIKHELIKEMCRVDKNITPINWYFPILRYHSMWNELEQKNFVDDYYAKGEYQSFKKGTNIIYLPYDGEPYDIRPELWEYEGEPDELFENSIYYYDKLIQECHDMGIEVFGVLTPKIYDASVYAKNYPVMKRYFESRGVKSINYCEPLLVNQMGLSLYDDYSDSSHLNAMGTIKFSNKMAMDISEMFDLPDRRLNSDDETTNTWNNLWDEMVEYYGTLDRTR